MIYIGNIEILTAKSAIYLGNVGSVEDLLSLHDEGFVRQAYRLLLRRAAGPAEFRDFLARVRNGESRAEIIAEIGLSEEGRRAEAKLPGLKALLKRHKLLTHPVLGPLLRLAGQDLDSTESLERRLISIEDSLQRIAEITARPAGAISGMKSETAAAAQVVRRALLDLLSLARPVCFFALDLTASARTETDGKNAKLPVMLAKSLLALGEPVVFVTWSFDHKSYRLLSRAELRARGLELATGPASPFRTYPWPDGPIMLVEDWAVPAQSWMLLSEVVYAQPLRAPSTVDLIMGAARLHLRSAAIFYDAAPLRSRDSTEVARRHEEYMQGLLLSDAVFAASTAAADDLAAFFVQHQNAAAIPVIRSIEPPNNERSDFDWLDYARVTRGAMAEIGDEARHVDSVYYLISTSSMGVSPAGAADVERSLALALLARGIGLIPVRFNEALGRLVPASDAAIPIVPPNVLGWSEWTEPQANRAPRWVVVAGMADGRVLNGVREYAARCGLRCAVILRENVGDGIPNTIAKIGASIVEFDKVFAESEATLTSFRRFLLGWKGRVNCAEHRYKALPLPTEILGLLPGSGATPRRSGPVTLLVSLAAATMLEASAVLDVLSDIAAVNRQTLRVQLAGAVPAGLADHPALVLPNVFVVPELNDGGLYETLKQADAAVLVGPAFVCDPVVKICSWLAVPCLTGRDRPEVAPASGQLFTDFADRPAFRAALERLTRDSSWRATIAAEAARGVVRTWNQYAAILLTELARDRPGENLTRAPRQTAIDIYTAFPSLRRRPKLSVCISTYNRAGWVALNLKNTFSQFPQLRDDVEFLVVDNASPDTTPEAVRPYLARPDFRYVRNPRNVGMLGNLTVTAQLARGEYFIILGDDDLIKPGAVDRIISVIDRYPGIGLVYLNYAHTGVDDPATITDLPSFLNGATPIEPACPDDYTRIKNLAPKNENIFSAIYCQVFRRDHGMRAYCQNTTGRIFSTMLTCIPTTYYVLNYMAEENGYWIGDPSIVINSNVSWSAYFSLFELEQFTLAHDLATRMGADADAMDRLRAKRLWLVEKYWKEAFLDDRHGNSPYLSGERTLLRIKHLKEFGSYRDSLKAAYEVGYRNDNPAAEIPPDELFGI